MHHRLVPVATLAVALLSPAAVAHAAPVTVDLRIEGPTKTVFEGRVRTDVRTFHFTAGDRTAHECNGTASTGGTAAAPVAVRNGALVTAAEAAGFALVGKWSTFGASFDRVGDQRVAFDAKTGRFLVEYKNGRVSQLGGCSDPIRNGDDVVYAYGTGNEKLLRLPRPPAAPPRQRLHGRRLAGPAHATPGKRFKVRVLAGGRPVRGATVAGRTTGRDGRATVGPFKRGL